jgi:hypothetical protein
MDAERPRDFAYGFALFDQSFGEFSLVFIHLQRASEADSPFMRVGAPGTSTLSDEVSLELGDAAEDGHDHLTCMGSGVGPGFGNGLEAGTGITDRFNDLKQVAGGACEAIELPDDDDISLAQLVDHPIETFSRKMRVQPAFLRASI